MVRVLPHEAFRLDFNMIVAEGKRQEEIHSANVGEFALVQNMHACFDSEILPRIVQNDWVFEAAARFANEYAGDCFRYLRLGGQEVYRTQLQLHDINSRVTEFLVEAYRSGIAPQAVSIDIAKA
jgi:hypothetical protein